MADQKTDELILIFGKTGWIGQKLGAICEDMGISYKYAATRLENREAVGKELDSVKPTSVINAAGVTGRPSVDWCEDHKVETMRANVIGNLTLADLCCQRNLHLTIMATGCIFAYDEEHPEGTGKGFTEDDTANFDGSFYSKTKGMVEQMLAVYPNVLNLRVRMPISDDLAPRNFITKIVKYEKVVNIPNSMTILHDLLPIAIKATVRKLKGIYNFTNPGAISHNEILALYKKYVKPDYTWKNFTIEEHDSILKSKRSNNELDASKLLKEFPELPHVQKSIHEVFKRMKVNLDKDAAAAEKGKRKAAHAVEKANAKKQKE